MSQLIWYLLGVKICLTMPTKQNSGTFKGLFTKFPTITPVTFIQDPPTTSILKFTQMLLWTCALGSEWIGFWLLITMTSSV